jgi:hypothetical protein
MSFQIEDSVEMPSRRNRYPFDQMQPGQSFEIVGADESRKVRNAAYQYAKKVNTAKSLAKGQDGYVAFALRKTAELPAAEEGKESTKIFRLWRE